MTDPTRHLLPPKAAAYLERRQLAGWSGKVELDVKDGDVCSWTFAGREPHPDDPTLVRIVSDRGKG